MKRAILPVLIAGAALFVNACDFTAAEEAFNEFDVIITLDEVSSFVALKVVDGETQNFVQESVNVRFVGENADQVIDMFSDPVDEMTVSGGLGSFGVSNELVPSSGEPVKVRISVSAPGYQSNSATIQLTKTGRTDGEIYLFRDNAGVAGSETGTNSGETDGQGAVTQELRTQTTTNPVNQAEASLTVRSGTQSATSTGAPASGMLQADIVYYTANNSSTAAAFPGGFDTPVLGLDGSVTETTFTTAGFMNVNVFDTDGNSITQFDPPIELTMEIEPGTHNPRTGQAVTDGDSITFFSYDEDDGVWVEEGEATLTGPGADGNYLATFFTPHLTTWSAGYTDDGCSSGTFDVQRNGNSGSIFARAYSDAGGWYGRTVVIPDGDSEFNIVNAPSFLPDFTIIFELAGQTRTVQQTGSICGASDVVSFDSPVNQVDVLFTMDLGPTCSALRVNDVPTLAIYYKLPGQSDAQATPVGSQPNFDLDNLGRITGGDLLVPGLELGQTYRFYTTINNERKERDIRISGTSASFDISQDVIEADICVQN